MKIDLFHIPEHQSEIHDRLENWSRWVKPGQGAATCPMFRMAKSNSRQWHAPEPRPTCNTLDAQQIEQEVRKLAKHYRDCLRWYYVHKYGERKAQRVLGRTADGLVSLVIDARQKLTFQLMRKEWA